MLARPMQEIRIKGIQDRRSTKQARRPWIVRLTIDGRERSKSFRTRAEADRYRVLLLQAAQAGERFDSVSGEPCAWRESMRDWPVHRWVRHWVSEQWPEWQPRTRASALEALARFVSLAVSDDARVPTDLRRYLERTLAASDANQLDDALEEWLDSHALSLMECTRDVLVGIDRRLALEARRRVSRVIDREEVSQRRSGVLAWRGVCGGDRRGPMAGVVESPRATEGRTSTRNDQRPVAARTIDDGPSHRRDRDAPAWQQDLQGDDRSRVLRRAPPVRSRDAEAEIAVSRGLRLGRPRGHRSRYLIRRTRRTQDWVTEGPRSAHPRRDAETVDRSERGPRARGLGLSNKVGTTTLALELVARLATRAYVDRRTAIEGLRLPPRLRNHVAPSRCTAGRDRTTSRTPSRHVGVDLRGST